MEPVGHHALDDKTAAKRVHQEQRGQAQDQLDAARATPAKGLDVGDLARHLKVDGLQLEPVIDTLLAMDWVGQLEDGRDVLLVDLDKTSAAPLVNALLLAEGASVENFMKNSQIPALNGRQLLHILERTGP